MGEKNLHRLAHHRLLELNMACFPQSVPCLRWLLSIQPESFIAASDLSFCVASVSLLQDLVRTRLDHRAPHDCAARVHAGGAGRARRGMHDVGLTTRAAG